MEKERGVDAKTYQETYEVYVNGVLTSSGNSGTPVTESPESFERIEYESGREKFNPCLHVKYVYAFHNTRTPVFTYTSVPVVQKWYNSHMSNRLQGVANVPLPMSPQGGVNQFLLRGLQNIRPKFAGKVSVPNFLFELKDLKKLIPSQQRVQDVSKHLKQFRGAINNPYGSGAKRASKASRRLSKLRALNTLRDDLELIVAEQNLNANFGWLPFVNDFLDFIEGMQSYNSKLENFLSYRNVPQTGHYKEIVSGHIMQTFETGSSFYQRTYKELEISDCTYVLTLKYTYDFDVMRMYFPSVFKRFLGFRNNPRIIWDAFPFSFAVDWIFKVGKALEALDDGAIPATLKVIDATLSCTYSAVTKHRSSDIPNATGTANIGTGRLDAHEGYRVYNRQRLDTYVFDLSGGVPPLPTFDHISVKETLLALSLGKTFKWF